MRPLTARLGVAVGAMALLAMLPTTAEANNTPHSDLVSTTAATFTPNLVSTGYRPIAYSINQAGSSMIVGGRFDRVENAARTVQYNRKNVFAFNATTGAVSPVFDPNVDGQVWSVLGNGDDVYIAGEFKNVDGVARPSVAKLSLSTGQLDTELQPEGRRRADHRPRAVPRAAVHVSAPSTRSCRPSTPTPAPRPFVLRQRAFTDPLQTRHAPRSSGSTSAPTASTSSRSETSRRSAGNEASTGSTMVDLGANSATALVVALRAPRTTTVTRRRSPIYQY